MRLCRKEGNSEYDIVAVPTSMNYNTQQQYRFQESNKADNWVKRFHPLRFTRSKIKKGTREMTIKIFSDNLKNPLRLPLRCS